MTIYYKAVRPDGTDFYSGTVQWAPPEGHEGDWVVRHPTSIGIGTDASSYLSVSTVPTDCVGTAWPCRLFEVEAVGDVETVPYFPNKVAGLAFRVVHEVDSHIALGPQGEYIAALIDRSGRLTGTQMNQLSIAGAAAESAAWDAAESAAWDAAKAAVRDAAKAAVRDAAWYTAWDAAWDAAEALLVRDLISTEHYDTLTRSWRTIIGPIHPDDDDTRRECAHCGGDGFEPMTGKFKESHACFVCGGEGEQ